MKPFCDLHQQQNASLGPVHTNLAIFETPFFLHKSAIRSQETSRSTIQEGILLKPPSRDRFETPSTRIRVKNTYNCAVTKITRLV